MNRILTYIRVKYEDLVWFMTNPYRFDVRASLLWLTAIVLLIIVPLLKSC